MKREKTLKWNKIFNTEFIPIRRVLQLSECRKERKKVLKREFRAIKKVLLQECEKERKKVLKSELRKVMKVLRLSERSPGAYSWDLFQQLDKDVFGAIKRGIEELEKVKVAKCNQVAILKEGCEKCDTKYTPIMTVEYPDSNPQQNIVKASKFCKEDSLYAHNDRLIKDPSNARKANQQTCRQCKNHFMCEQNYIPDYARDAHQKCEFQQRQTYEHEPKESGEVGSMNEINNTINEAICGYNNHAHDVQKKTYEHEPKASGEVDSMNEINNTINEAICDYNNHAHNVQFPYQKQIYEHEPKESGKVDSMHKINNNHVHDVQFPHQKQIYEHEFQQHEPKEKKIIHCVNLNNTINEAICEEEKIRLLEQQELKFEQIQREAEERNRELRAQLLEEKESDYNNHAHDVQFPHQKQIYEHEREVDSMNDISNSINEAICDYNHASSNVQLQPLNHAYDVQFPYQKQIYEHEREVDSMNDINNTINEAITEKEINAIKNVVHDVQFPKYGFLQKHIYEHKPKEIEWSSEVTRIFLENAFPYLRSHSWSFFNIGFQNGIRKKLAFTFRRRKIYYSRNKFIKRRNGRKYHQTKDNNDYNYLDEFC